MMSADERFIKYAGSTLRGPGAVWIHRRNGKSYLDACATRLSHQLESIRRQVLLKLTTSSALAEMVSKAVIFFVGDVNMKLSSEKPQREI